MENTVNEGQTQVYADGRVEPQAGVKPGPMKYLP